VRIHNV